MPIRLDKPKAVMPDKSDRPVIVAVIPARGGSKRLPKKNIYPVLGRPMLAWVVDALLQTKRISPSNVVVSSDSDDILSAADESGAVPLRRSRDLATDTTWTEPVIRHAVEEWEVTNGRRADIVLWMNASIPEVTTRHIELCLDRLVDGGFREVLTIDPSGTLTSATRAMVRAVIDQEALTVNASAVPGDFIDIHTIEDLHRAEDRLRRRQRPAKD